MYWIIWHEETKTEEGHPLYVDGSAIVCERHVKGMEHLHSDAYDMSTVPIKDGEGECEICCNIKADENDNL